MLFKSFIFFYICQSFASPTNLSNLTGVSDSMLDSFFHTEVYYLVLFIKSWQVISSFFEYPKIALLCFCFWNISLISEFWIDILFYHFKYHSIVSGLHNFSLNILSLVTLKNMCLSTQLYGRFYFFVPFYAFVFMSLTMMYIPRYDFSPGWH